MVLADFADKYVGIYKILWYRLKCENKFCFLFGRHDDRHAAAKKERPEGLSLKTVSVYLTNSISLNTGLRSRAL